MLHAEENKTAETSCENGVTLAEYIAPDIDTAPGELMQTIRGTGGGCDVVSSGSDDGCSST